MSGNKLSNAVEIETCTSQNASTAISAGELSDTPFSSSVINQMFENSNSEASSTPFDMHVEQRKCGESNKTSQDDKGVANNPDFEENEGDRPQHIHRQSEKSSHYQVSEYFDGGMISNQQRTVKRMRRVKRERITFCRGNPIRACHENELSGKSGDRRHRCAVCRKKSNYFCLDCKRWFCLSTKNDIAGEAKYLRFSVTTSGRRRSRSTQGNQQATISHQKKFEGDNNEKDDQAKTSKITVQEEVLYAYRSCWNMFHGDVLREYEAPEDSDSKIEEAVGRVKSSPEESKKSNPITNLFAV